MVSTWLPAPVAILWAALFVLVLLVHAGHACVMRGRHRLWHLGHVLMAIGMVTMFWPAHSGMLVPAGAGGTAYLVAAGALAVALLVARARRVALGPLWLVSVADLAWMAYMFAMMHSRALWLGVAGAAWFAAQAVGWATGTLGRLLEHRGLGPPARVPVAVAPTRGDAEHDLESRQAERVRPGIVDGGHRDWSVRISLTVMGTGMAYMMLAMQFGTAVMPPMSAGGMGM